MRLTSYVLLMATLRQSRRPRVRRRRATGNASQQQVSGNILKRQIFFWLAALVFFIAFLYVFSSILLPFIAGMAIAYFLDPVADRLERLGLRRMMATIGILVAFVIVLRLALMILIPVLISQFNDFAQRLPGYISQLQQFIAQAQNSLAAGLGREPDGHDQGTISRASCRRAWGS